MTNSVRYSIEGRRLLILTGGCLGVFESKTATSILRYHPRQVVAVLDEVHAGEKLDAMIGIGAGVPIVGSVEEGLAQSPNQLLIGVAPVGGTLEASWRKHIRDALRAGLDVVAGLHIVLGHDEEFATLARERNARIFDLREPPPDIPIASGRARLVAARRVLTVGTDCNVGKMVTALELRKALQARRRDAAFVATGQTGIMIEGRGIAVDRVISDFVAGAAEMLVCDHADHEILCLEGQGSIINPAYSGVTLGLLHGSCPDALILCHHAPRTQTRHFEGFPLPSLEAFIDLYERMAAPVFPAKVVGISLNTIGMGEEEALKQVEHTIQVTGLPATDPVRFGSEALADAIIRFIDEE